MDKSIIAMLELAQEGREGLLLEAPVLTDAGREELIQFKEHAKEEIQRIEVLLDNGAINHPNHNRLVEDLERYQDLVRDIDEAVTAPDHFVHFVKTREVDNQILFESKIDNLWVPIQLDRSAWLVLGCPQVLKLDGSSMPKRHGDVI